MLSTIFKYAIRNLFRTRLRSLFTLFSIVLIITLYTVLASTGSSFTMQIEKILNQQDIDIAVQARYASSPITSKIPSETVDLINSYEQVSRSEMLLINRLRIRDKTSLFLLGVSNYEVFAQRLGFSLVNGRIMRSNKKEIIIGEKMSKVLNVFVGDDLKLSGDESYAVVGIYSSWLNFLNAGIVLDLTHAQKITGKPNQASLLFLELQDSTKTESLIKKINSQFPDMRAIDSLQFPNYLGPIKSVFYFSKIVSLLTLIIAVFVLLNTFVMAISERTKEIGILSAIGWTRRSIIYVFIVESLFISFVGGLIGYFLAFPIMNYLQYKFKSVYMYFPESPSVDIFLNVLLLCFFVGLLSALFPALYGTKLNISKALNT